MVFEYTPDDMEVAEVIFRFFAVFRFPKMLSFSLLRWKRTMDRPNEIGIQTSPFYFPVKTYQQGTEGPTR